MRPVQQGELAYSSVRVTAARSGLPLSICASMHGSLQSKQRDATSRGLLPASCAETDCSAAAS